ncbi:MULTISPECIES: helix-turn-helix domain-containing protein [unclassified Solwaraspora]|uniref:helix-turn-helix domain-containing protein n=1 Tax=unclassified Solwaraspora TaxID=2627926 RepID=UPI00259B6C37|nr:helix-turn-helix transcriptional regulator [Solwaraspora sp. WMMA2056]WJK40508.1 helix-turn-helix transcriptional regulator [Solwaraspora sp. WMMA2056]
MQPEQPIPSPTLRRRRLGSELRRLRESAGLTGEQVIERVNWASASKLSRLENGRSRPGVGDVMDLLDLYGVTGADRDELVAIARDAGNTRAFLSSYKVMTSRQRAYAELEAGCTEIQEYGAVIIPGLLQTSAYAKVRIMSARPLVGPGDQMTILRQAASSKSANQKQPAGARRQADDPDTEVAARQSRQSMLLRDNGVPRYTAVLEESALGLRCGPPDVMVAQLQHLRAMAQLDNVTLRVLPPGATVASWYLSETAFSIYHFADPEDPSAVAIETLAADIIVNDAPVLERYGQVFDWLCEAARSPAESIDWLAEEIARHVAAGATELSAVGDDEPSPATPAPLSPPATGGTGPGRPAGPPIQRGPRERPTRRTEQATPE